MSVVSWMVETADGFLVDAAESQFGAVASNTGTIVLLMVEPRATIVGAFLAAIASQLIEARRVR